MDSMAANAGWRKFILLKERLKIEWRLSIMQGELEKTKAFLLTA